MTKIRIATLFGLLLLGFGCSEARGEPIRPEQATTPAPPRPAADAAPKATTSAVEKKPFVETLLPDQPVARVNGQEITYAEFAKQFEYFARFAARRAGPDAFDRARSTTMDALVWRTIVEQAVQAAGIRIDDAEVDAALPRLPHRGRGAAGRPDEKRRDITRLRLQVRALMTAAGELDLTEADARAAYATRPEFKPIRVNHILIPVARDTELAAFGQGRRRATTIIREARKPGVDLADLARRHAVEVTAMPGFFTVLDRPRLKSLYTTPVGAVGRLPSLSDDGWHIYQVAERLDAPSRPFEQVRPRVEAYLVKRLFQRKRHVWRIQQRRDAEVEILVELVEPRR